jgi:hypothetical protein
VNIHTVQGVAQALERLRQRDPKVLASFIVSLAQDAGPIGEQVRTFIVGDEIAETVASVRQRIAHLRTPSDRDLRYRVGREIGERLQFIVDSIQTLILPVNPGVAFELLVSVIERDGHAMESCGDHGDSVASAMERAAGLIAHAAASLPTLDVAKTLQRLLDADGYGVRAPLAVVLNRIAPQIWTAGS